MEADYYERVKEEYKDEIGLFGRVDSPKFSDTAFLGSKDSSLNERLGNYMSNRIEGYIEDDAILKDIDKEIKLITDAEMNETNKKKNMK